jgi:hypothetical protein
MLHIPIRRAFALVALLAQAGCSAVTPPEVIQDSTKRDSTESELALSRAKSDFARSRALWTSARPATYDYTITVSCFCGREITRAVVVVVQGATVVSRTYVDDGTPVPAASISLFSTIEGVFDIIGNAVDHNYAHVGVTYDTALAYPTTIALDESTAIVDDERVYTLTNFHVR